MVTATISSTSAPAPSRICIAASMPWVSKGFRFFSPERSSRIVEESIRFCTAASGTSFTRQQIFKCVPPWGWVGERAAGNLSDRPR
jgi:hypothetical protein